MALEASLCLFFFKGNSRDFLGLCVFFWCFLGFFRFFYGFPFHFLGFSMDFLGFSRVSLGPGFAFLVICFLKSSFRAFFLFEKRSRLLKQIQGDLQI